MGPEPTSQGRNWCVVGGAGFIGSVFISKLNAEGIDDILIVDHLGTSSKWKNLSRKSFLDYVPKDKFIGMLHSAQFPGGGCAAEIKAIIHLGACSTTTELDMDYLMENNVRFSREVIEFAARNGIRLIYEALKKTGGKTDGDALIEAMKGMKWESPRGPIMIDPETRDIVQNIYIRKVEKVGGSYGATVYRFGGNAAAWLLVRGLLDSSGDPGAWRAAAEPCLESRPWWAGPLPD